MRRNLAERGGESRPGVTRELSFLLPAVGFQPGRGYFFVPIEEKKYQGENRWLSFLLLR